jgi:intein-encoded DNA endonuclease-like protein
MWFSSSDVFALKRYTRSRNQAFLPSPTDPLRTERKEIFEPGKKVLYKEAIRRKDLRVLTLRILRDYMRDNFYKNLINTHKFMIKTTLEKDWVAGFLDGDGSFSTEKVKNGRVFHNQGYNYRPVLSVAQNDVKILYKLKDYFGCGEVTQKKNKAWHYKVRTTAHFKEFIIPKLGDNPFQTKNQLKYQLLRNKAIPLMDEGPNDSTLEQLDQLHEEMKLLSEDRDYVNPNLPITLEWFKGFFEAEGNLYYRCRSKSGKVDVRISLKVTQKNLNLLNKIDKFFTFGAVQKERGEIFKFNVEGIGNVAKAVPVFLKTPFKGDNNIKRCKFLIFLRIVEKGGHKTTEGLERCDKLVRWSSKVV